MADAADLKSVSCKGVWVRVPPSAPPCVETSGITVLLSFAGFPSSASIRQLIGYYLVHLDILPLQESKTKN